MLTGTPSSTSAAASRADSAAAMTVGMVTIAKRIASASWNRARASSMRSLLGVFFEFRTRCEVWRFWNLADLVCEPRSFAVLWVGIWVLLLSASGGLNRRCAPPPFLVGECALCCETAVHAMKNSPTKRGERPTEQAVPETGSAAAKEGGWMPSCIDGGGR